MDSNSNGVVSLTGPCTALPSSTVCMTPFVCRRLYDTFASPMHDSTYFDTVGLPLLLWHDAHPNGCDLGRAHMPPTTCIAAVCVPPRMQVSLKELAKFVRDTKGFRHFHNRKAGGPFLFLFSFSGGEWQMPSHTCRHRSDCNLPLRAVACVFCTFYSWMTSLLPSAYHSSPPPIAPHLTAPNSSPLALLAPFFLALRSFASCASLIRGPAQALLHAFNATCEHEHTVEKVKHHRHGTIGMAPSA